MGGLVGPDHLLPVIEAPVLPFEAPFEPFFLHLLCQTRLPRRLGLLEASPAEYSPERGLSARRASVRTIGRTAGSKPRATARANIELIVLLPTPVRAITSIVVLFEA